MKQENQEKLWSKIAKEWRQYRDMPLQEVFEFLKDKKGKILDLGCGAGRNFLKLEESRIYGVDFSDEMLRYARKRAKEKNLKVELIKADAWSLPFPDSLFDSAIYIAALHCLETEKKRKESLKELKRVLKPKSKALISVWNKKQRRFRNKAKKVEVGWNLNGKKVKRYYYLYDKQELVELLRQMGFKIINSWANRNIFVIIKKI